MDSTGIFSKGRQNRVLSRMKTRFNSKGRYTNCGITKAISEIVPIDESIVDIGCGVGSFIRELRLMGFDTFGLDGTVGIEKITDNVVKQVDILEGCQEFYRCADWGLFFEVGEHIPKELQRAVLKQVCSIPRKSMIVSWAPIGKWGRGHVNCKDEEEVIKLFNRHNWQFDSDTTKEINGIAKNGKRNLLVFHRIPYSFVVDNHSKALLQVIKENLHFNQIKAFEIGTWRGKNARSLVENVSNMKLWCVDPYIESLADEVLTRRFDSQEAKCIAFETLLPYKDRIRWLLLKSEQAAKWFRSRSFQFGFIDGNQYYEDVKFDITAWWPKICRGGILAGHDYGGQKDRIGVFGVKKAVHEFFGDKVNICKGRSRVWWIQK